ncbi:HIRAN domain-containing protein [Lacrimispora sp.]|uniref:HIRAN domain-containing protein n=1 Tax=Lacrimispora sp. TaxID=2719234 RepID=UPI00286446E0|nr:HIRAN domain-containing protein [Lacrimispora sp.]MDR7812093.1 HIRAN domain-containing protein [Lacrimispora sp.]
MSIKNGKDYMYLIWKSEKSRRQYIVGELSKNGEYEFKYSEEVNDAIQDGFTPFMPFTDINKMYNSTELFPVFLSRLPDRKRKDMDKILDKYGMVEYDPYQLLKISGARLPIDNMQFIDPILDYQNSFERQFYMAGSRYYLGCEGNDCNKSILVQYGEEVYLKKEPKNTHDPNAIRVINGKKDLLGYIPRYYCKAFSKILDQKRDFSCHVVNINQNKCCSECILLEINVK